MHMKTNTHTHKIVIYLFCGTLFASALIFVYLFFIRNPTGQYLDESAYLGAINKRSISTQRPIYQITSKFLQLLPTISTIIIFFGMFFITIIRRNIIQTIAALSFFCVANISSQILKNVIFSRPKFIDAGSSFVDLDNNSAPSGHVTIAITTFFAIYLISAKRWRGLVSFLGVIFSFFTGIAVFINLWHRPSDVIASYTLVGFWLCIFLAFMGQQKPTIKKQSYSFWWPTTFLTSALALALVLATSVTIKINEKILINRIINESEEQLSQYYYVGILVIGFVVLLTNSIILFADMKPKKLF